MGMSVLVGYIVDLARKKWRVTIVRKCFVVLMAFIMIPCSLLSCIPNIRCNTTVIATGLSIYVMCALVTAGIIINNFLYRSMIVIYLSDWT